MKPFAAPDVVSQAPAGTAGGLAEITLALAAVLAAVFVFGWVLRRLRGVGRPGAARIEVLAEAALGTRERAVLIRIGTQQLLVGVAPGHLQTLHVLDGAGAPLEAAAASGADAAAQAAAAAAATGATPRVPSFRDLLMRSLGR